MFTHSEGQEMRQLYLCTGTLAPKRVHKQFQVTKLSERISGKMRMHAQPCTQTYPAVQVLEPGGMLVPHGQILVQNLAGLLHLKLLHAEEAEDEGGVQAHAADVRLGLEPFPHLSQGALTHFRLLLQMAKKTLIS